MVHMTLVLPTTKPARHLASPVAALNALDTSVGILRSIVVASPSETDLKAITEKIRQAEAALGSLKLTVAQHANRLNSRGLSGTAQEVLGSNQTVSRQEAKREAARADAVAQVPGLGQALAAGEIGTGHLDVIAQRTRSLRPRSKTCSMPDAS